MSESFGKHYKLTSKKEISQLFIARNSLRAYPFVVFFNLHTETASKHQLHFVVSSPKRLLKKSHDRNRVKRLTREVIRKNKLSLELHCKKNRCDLNLFIIYNSSVEMPISVMEKKMRQLFNTLSNEIDKKITSNNV
jgi:ribonuclease P protein component